MGRVAETLRAIGAPLIFSLTLANCTTQQGSSIAPAAPLTVGLFAPYSGPDASFGDVFTAACLAATYLIDKQGGVLGHQLNCKSVDSRGDPADAIPAMRQMLLTSSNLVLMEGLTSDEASATVPLVERAKLVLMDASGESSFDHNTNPYFWRMYPADDSAGYAMAAWAQYKGYTQAVAVFGNDIGSQGTVPTLLRGFRKAGGTITLNLSVALDQMSYRPEVQQVIAAKPQVIFMEVDPQTAATFLSQLAQVHALYPTVGADPELLTDWYRAVSGAIGAQSLTQSFVAENPSTASNGPAWAIYNSALLAAPGVPSPGDHATDAVSEIFFDATTIAALAMLAAKSIDPIVYNSAILGVTKATVGAVVVNSFADGKRALANGEHIVYVGVSGPVDFNQWHNSAGGFDIDQWSTGAQLVPVGHITVQQITPLEA